MLKTNKKSCLEQLFCFVLKVNFSELKSSLSNNFFLYSTNKLKISQKVIKSFIERVLCDDNIVPYLLHYVQV